MAGQDGGYGLGVDLGTSHTVAVLRWPDGRTRPLLFDGQPILPSGVFLDPSGRTHVGRDAQRLAQADPARYEPHPKRRIDEPAVLLGDREIPPVDLLASVLGAVANTAVEAVGFLPPAVLSYPATWGARRREVLAAAVGRAGWPPVANPGPASHPTGGTLLVPEPVAAARYFSDVLRRPVPVGSALAVFDFGGGTLDIAVVRNEGTDDAGRPRFTVVGSGGVSDLGGLDLDAALVQHLGGVLDSAHGVVWQQLHLPVTASQWRNRRQFWDDVRGAKEMLSRAAVAPVPVPGVEQALHLTRDELEAVVTPLLRRGVHEAASVLANSRVGIDQLAGLFLVGGSSRVPLVARLLHAELGIAPTVLEQPELPVAEGALAELPETLLVAAPTSPGPAGPGQPYPGALPSAPGGPPGRRARLPRRTVWIGAGALVALVGVVVAAVLYLTRDPYPALDFAPFKEIDRVAIREGDGYGRRFTAIAGDRAYLGYPRSDKRLDIAVTEAGTAKVHRWITTDSSAEQWLEIRALPDALIVRADAIGVSTPREILAYDPDDGRRLWSRQVHGDDEVFYFDRYVVVLDDTADTVVGIDARTGDEWSRPSPKGDYSSDSVLYPVEPAERFGGSLGPGGDAALPNRGDEPRLVQIGADGSIRVLDVRSGAVLRSRPNAADTDDRVLAYEGQLFVAPTAEGYGIARYDLKTLDAPTNIYSAPDNSRRPVGLQPCGDQQVCLLEISGSDRATTELVAVPADGGAEHRDGRWRRKVPQAQEFVSTGDDVLVRLGSSEPTSKLFDADGGNPVSRDGVALPADGGNLLSFDSAPTLSSVSVSIAGIDTGSGQVTELGPLKGVILMSCAWNTSVIVCPTNSEFVFARFAGW